MITPSAHVPLDEQVNAAQAARVAREIEAVIGNAFLTAREAQIVRRAVEEVFRGRKGHGGLDASRRNMTHADLALFAVRVIVRSAAQGDPS